MDLLKRTSIRQGYTPITVPGQSETKLIEFGIITLNEGEEQHLAASTRQRVGVILEGICDILGDRFGWKHAGERRGVFEGKAAAFYLPPRFHCRVIARTHLCIALAGVEADVHGEPVFVEPDDVVVRHFGRDNFSWQVHHVFNDSHLAGCISVGEQFTPPGNSSSYPPHSHTAGGPSPGVEELCFFKVRPQQGFGYARVYTADRDIDETYSVLENDTLIIPCGFHTITAVPGYQLYCLFVHAGDIRNLQVQHDPNHSWVT